MLARRGHCAVADRFKHHFEAARPCVHIRRQRQRTSVRERCRQHMHANVALKVCPLVLRQRCLHRCLLNTGPIRDQARGYTLHSETIIEAGKANLRPVSAKGTSSSDGRQQLSYACIIQNLQNGTPYAFKVRTANAVCVSSLPAEFSELIAPATKPGPPIIRSAVGGNHEISLFADPPQDNGGAPVVRFRFAVTRVQDQKIVAEIVCPVTDVTSTGSLRCTGLDEDTLYSVSGYVLRNIEVFLVDFLLVSCLRID